MNDLLAESGVLERLLPAERRRVLTQPEMIDLAGRISADPALWRSHVRYSEDRRHYVSLHRDADVEVWLICWTPRSDTGWHDHDSSAGAVAVAEGAVVEHRLAIGRPETVRVASRGDSFSFGADHIHRMCGQEAESTTVHVYSPPLWRMGQYSIDEQGLLRRVSVSYADELRPLESA